ncbi:hypothetical protein Q1695_015584 [Nippostrongylus brasiliensis]|nr:hypothetical protein Q1695_015584 [Nippostrongylus brasiliensis]
MVTLGWVSLLCCLLLMGLLEEVYSTASCKMRELEKSKWLVPAKSSLVLDVFVHRGLEYGPSRAFTDVFLQLNITDEDSYDLYKGKNCSAVHESFEHDNRMFGLLKGVTLWRSHQLDVFNDTVVGIATRLPYSVQAKVVEVNYIRLGVFIAGILLFWFARSLVRNAIFFYGSGCTFGLLASLLIVVFIVYRLAPKKMIGLPILIGGWSLAVYILNFAWKNFSTIAIQYQQYLIGYVVSVILISLAVCYKRGPPTDSRSHDIAQWTLQLISLVLIYASSQVKEVSAAVIFVLVFHQLTRSWLWFLISSIFGYLWRKVSPPKRRLLTREEYEKEGQETTKRELQRLREYCRSPDADVWKITSRVHDPRRLARFVAGKEGHVLEEEEEMYEEDSGNTYSEGGEEDDFSDRYENDNRDIDYEENDWDEEEVIKSPPKSRYEKHFNFKESSFRRSPALPRNGSRLMEPSAQSRSTYWNDSPQLRRSLPRPGSSSSSSRRYVKDDRDDAVYDSSFLRRYVKRQEAVKHSPRPPAASSSNEFFSSDSDPDVNDEYNYDD